MLNNMNCTLTCCMCCSPRTHQMGQVDHLRPQTRQQMTHAPPASGCCLLSLEQPPHLSGACPGTSAAALLLHHTSLLRALAAASAGRVGDGADIAGQDQISTSEASMRDGFGGLLWNAAKALCSNHPVAACKTFTTIISSWSNGNASTSKYRTVQAYICKVWSIKDRH